MSLSDFSEVYTPEFRPQPSPARLSSGLTTAPSEISRFPLMKRMHMPQVSDSGEPNEHSHIALIHIAFPLVQQGRHSRMVISELNTAPMHTPANASPRPHWSSRHSSGPERIANLYSVEDLAQSLTSYFMPVLTGAFWTSRMPSVFTRTENLNRSQGSNAANNRCKLSAAEFASELICLVREIGQSQAHLHYHLSLTSLL